MLKKSKLTIATLTFVFVAFVVASPAYAQTLSGCDLLEAELTAIELELDAIEVDLGGQVDKCTRNLTAKEAIVAGLRVDIADYKKSLGEERERRIRAEARAPGWKWALGGAAVSSAATVLVYLLVIR